MDIYEVYGSGFGPFLEPFSLSLYKQGLVWVTGENRDTKAADDNGVGKSHIPKAITWCIYGDSIDKCKGDEVIHERAKRAEVGIKFGTSTQAYWELCRRRTKGSLKLSLKDPNGIFFSGKTADIQDRVIDLFGQDFVSFRHTCLYGQNDVTKFAHPRTTDAQRKDVMHRVMRTEITQECHKKALSLASEKRSELANVEGKISNIQARVSEYDVDAIEEQFDDWESRRKASVDRVKKEARSWRESASAREYIDDASSILSAIDFIKLSLEQATDLRSEIDLLEQKAHKASERLSQARVDLESATRDVNDVVDRLSDLESDKCPTCMSSLSKGEAKKYVTSLTSGLENLRIIQADAKDALASADKLHEDIVDLMRKRKLELGKLSAQKDQLPGLYKKLADARSADERNKERCRHALEMAKAKLQEAKRLAGEINPYDERLRKAEERVDNLEKESKVLGEKAQKKRCELAHIEFWVRGFSNHGLPSFLMDAAMPFTTNRANHYLSTLSDGDISVNFGTQRELKSTKGEFRDEISIDWTIEGTTNKPPSGGQFKKIDLSTDFAFMDLVASREGECINLLILDEVFDGLDREGRARVSLLLQELRAKRGTVLVISHDPNMSEIFEKSVKVIKEDGASILEVCS